jgi:transposase-like protein
MARKRQLPDELTEASLDALTEGVRSPEQQDDLFRDLKKALVERVRRAELTQHLDYPEGDERPAGGTNARNGTTPKTVLTDEGARPLEPSYIAMVFDALRVKIRGEGLVQHKIDGLTGFPATIAAVFPQTVIHLCVVHLVRQSLQYVNWEERSWSSAPTLLLPLHLPPLHHRG